jgi:cysteine desulfuration protein SufE
MTDKLQALYDDFDLLDEWEDRYRYIIELGKNLPPFDDRFRDAAHKVSGCASQVWIQSEPAERDGRTVITYSGDSDALIVKGLIAIALRIFSGRTPEDILRQDAGAVFARLGLSEHLTQQRSNGLASMVKRIKSDALAAAQAAE